LLFKIIFCVKNTERKVVKLKNKYELFVDNSADSKKAIILCRKELEGEFEIVDVSNINEPPDLCPRPRLLTPEGRFKHLDGIKEYISHYGKHGDKTPITQKSDMWTLLPVH